MAFACFVWGAALDAQIPIALEQRVHPASLADEVRPSISADQTGRTVVAWEASSDQSIFARSFSSLGEPLTAPWIVHTGAVAFRTNPSVSLERQGAGLVAWGSLAETGLSPAGPFVRCLDAEGRPSCAVFQAAQEELELNGVGGSVDFGSRGLSAYAWYVYGFGATLPRLAAAVYSGSTGASGQTFIVDEAFESGTDARSSPRVAAIGADRIVVVWSELGVDANGHAVVGRLFSESGAPLGPAFRISTFESGDQVAPDVAASEDGSFVVVWESWGQDGFDQGIFAQRFAGDGAKVGEEFQVSSDAATGQFSASVDMDAAGRFAVSWTSHQEDAGLSRRVFARAYRADGTPLGEQFQVSQDGASSGEQDTSDIAISDAGTIGVAYESYRCEPGGGDACSRDVLASWFTLPCEADVETLCLQDGRFLVRTFWKDYSGRQGRGNSVQLTRESGGFWFFGENDFELLAKVIDGCDYNGRFWFFAGGLTDVEVELILADSRSGRVSVFRSSLGTPFQPILTMNQFPGCFEGPPPLVAPEEPIPLPGAPAVLCGGQPAAACLHGGRFAVEVDWRDFAGNSGAAGNRDVGDDSALFWFFSSTNLELAAKIVDGCAINNKFWVYLTGLTNVGVDTRIVDTWTGIVWERGNRLGTSFPPVFDIEAFASCQVRP